MSKQSKTYNSFQIIRRYGTPKKAQLPDGTTVYAEEKFFVPEYSGFIKCIQYDDHFLYEIPSRIAHMYPGAIYRCSCGSPAVVVGVSGYVWGGSPEGLMMGCKHHLDFHKHATGGDTWI